MIKGLVSVLLLVSNIGYGQTGADLLLKKNGHQKFQNQYQHKQLKLNLDDVFLVQAYGAFRSLGVKNLKFINYLDNLFAGNLKGAINQNVELKILNREERRLYHSSLIYVFYKLGMSQSAFDYWVNESSLYDFSNTQLGVALDEIIGKKASEWLVSNAVFISKEQAQKIAGFKSHQSHFNHSVQAYSHLRTGLSGLEFIGPLKDQDPLRILLAQSALVAYAKKGELGNAANIIKQVIEPIIEKSDDSEQIAAYYLMLARLLYQANAFKEAREYYEHIPDKSRYFVTAQTELMWLGLVIKDYSRVLGIYQSFKTGKFQKYFNPEVHLVGAMANLYLCQFSKVQESFSLFVKENKFHAREAFKGNEGKLFIPAEPNHFYFSQLSVAKHNLKNEKEKIAVLIENSPLKTELISSLDKKFNLVHGQNQNEIVQSWKNRRILIQNALRRMRFAKVEYLSAMRRYKDKLAQTLNEDSVSSYTSGIDKTDKILFPYDGVMFGDELLHYHARIKKLCLQESKNEN